MGVILLAILFGVLCISIIFILVMIIYIKKKGFNIFAKTILIGTVLIITVFCLEHYESESDYLSHFGSTLAIFEIDKLEDLYKESNTGYTRIHSSQSYDDGEIYHVTNLYIYLNSTTNEIYGTLDLWGFSETKPKIDEEYNFYYEKGEFHFMEEVSDEIQQKLENHKMMFEICDIDEEYLKSLNLESKSTKYHGSFDPSGYDINYKIPNDDENLKKIKEAYPQYMIEDTYEATYCLSSDADTWGYSKNPNIKFDANNECRFSLEIQVESLSPDEGAKFFNEVKYSNEEEEPDYLSNFNSLLSIFEIDKLEDLYEKSDSEYTSIYSHNGYDDNEVYRSTSMYLYLNNETNEIYGTLDIGEFTDYKNKHYEEYNLYYEKGEFHFMEEVSDEVQQQLDNHKMMYEICNINKEYLRSLELEYSYVSSSGFYNPTSYNLRYKIPNDDKILKKIKEVFPSNITKDIYEATCELDSDDGLSFYTNNEPDFSLMIDIDYKSNIAGKLSFEEIKYSNEEKKKE